MKKKTPRSIKRVSISMPQDVYAKAFERARAGHRSVSGYIAFLISEAKTTVLK